MKKIFRILTTGAATLALLTSCVGELNVTPIDPNVVRPEDVLDSYADNN